MQTRWHRQWNELKKCRSCEFSFDSLDGYVCTEIFTLAEVKKCTRCRSTIDIHHFSWNRKGGHNKTCDGCLTKTRECQRTAEAKSKWHEWDILTAVYDKCGNNVEKNVYSIHKRRWWCQAHGLNPKPEFETWLMEQDDATLWWEYKALFNEIL